MRIFIDIETCPTTDPAVIADIRSSIRAPANYSKPESIQQWMETKGEQAAIEAIGKTALSPEDGSIIAVCIATDDGEPVVIMRTPEEPTDARLLEAAFTHIDGLLEDASTNSCTDPDRLIFRPEPYFIGHNLTGFDLPFLWKRSLINGVVPPFTLPAPDEIRHARNCFDTMTAWAGYRSMIGLSRLCRVLGIPDPKQNEDGITGANAWEFWQRGDLDAVDAYNRGDVLAVRAIFQRLEAMTRRAAA